MLRNIFEESARHSRLRRSDKLQATSLKSQAPKAASTRSLYPSTPLSLYPSISSSLPG
jgi:hypothetical protein